MFAYSVDRLFTFLIMYLIHKSFFNFDEDNFIHFFNFVAHAFGTISKNLLPALACVAPLVGALSHNLRFACSIPSQGKYRGYGFGPWFGCVLSPVQADAQYRHVQRATNQCTDVSLSPFLSL